MQACLQGDEHEVARLLVSARVNARDEEGMTALFYACKQGHAMVVNRLLRAHAEVNVKNHFGATPLITASTNGHLVVVDQLLRRGACAEVQDLEGKTALIRANLNKHHGIVSLLVGEKIRGDMPSITIHGNNSIVAAKEKLMIQALTELHGLGKELNVHFHPRPIDMSSFAPMKARERANYMDVHNRQLNLVNPQLLETIRNYGQDCRLNKAKEWNDFIVNIIPMLRMDLKELSHHSRNPKLERVDVLLSFRFDQKRGCRWRGCRIFILRKNFVQGQTKEWKVIPSKWSYDGKQSGLIGAPPSQALLAFTPGQFESTKVCPACSVGWVHSPAGGMAVLKTPI